MTMKTSASSTSLNTPIYFRLTRILALLDIVISLTDTIVTALIFFGEEQDVLKSLYYKVVKQRGITVFHSSEQVRWNQNLFSWVALVVTTMFNLLWFNASCYLLYATTNTHRGGEFGMNRIGYCRSWLLVSLVLLLTYSTHLFTNGQDCPLSLLASLTALVYRVFAVSVVYGLLLHLEETVRRPFYSTVHGIYLTSSQGQGQPPGQGHPQGQFQFQGQGQGQGQPSMEYHHQDRVKSFPKVPGLVMNPHQHHHIHPTQQVYRGFQQHNLLLLQANPHSKLQI